MRRELAGGSTLFEPVRETVVNACRVCDNREGNRTIVVREMMFGTREPFPYIECGRCGCIQIEEVPRDLSRHYPGDYYAFSGPRRESLLKRHLKRALARYSLGRRSLVGALLARYFAPPPFAAWIREAGAVPGARILDVGCGAGHLLRELHGAGFTDLTGVDPYIERDFEDAPGLVRLRRTLAELTGEFELVMVHHSFEHMNDPMGAARHLARLVSASGTVLIRIPIADSSAWRAFGADWVQLDAPRHLFVHTRDSMRRVAEAAGLRIERVHHDSTGFQFWGSEQYRRDIPLFSEGSVAVDPKRSGFSKQELAAFDARAQALNAAGDGDQACFYLRRA